MIAYVIGPAANRSVLVEEQSAFSHAGWSLIFRQSNLATEEGERHRAHREAMLPAFTMRRMGSYLGLIERHVDAALDGLAGVVDTLAVLRTWSHNLAVEAFMGADAALGLLASSDPSADLTGHAAFLLEASTETMPSLGAWTLRLLADHPDVVVEALPSPLTTSSIRAATTIEAAITETERLYPPVPFGPRRVVAETSMGLPIGTMVAYCIAATHRLPSLYENPDAFVLGRQRPDPFALVGFGGGPRRCLGMTFARFALTVFVSRFCERFRFRAVVAAQQVYAVTARPVGLELFVAPA